MIYLQRNSLAFDLRKAQSLPMTHAVLTGDLIGSTASPDRVERSIAALRAVRDEPWLTDLRFSRFRGDGWQMSLPRAGLSLRLSLRIAAGLAAVDGLPTRISIGLGRIEHIGTVDLSDASGIAFLRSGRGLDHLARGRVWAIDGGTALPDWTAGLIALAHWHAARWTGGQAQVVADWLNPAPRTQDTAALATGLSRQAWKARLDGSGIVSWTQALHAFEAWDGAGITDD